MRGQKHLTMSYEEWIEKGLHPNGYIDIENGLLSLEWHHKKIIPQIIQDGDEIKVGV